jgi:hypothetical protein
MIEEVLARCPDIALADPDVPVTRTPSWFIFGIPSLPVVFGTAR